MPSLGKSKEVIEQSLYQATMENGDVLNNCPFGKRGPTLDMSGLSDYNTVVY